MSHEEGPQLDGETSDEQHNSSDAANASRKGQPWSEEEHLAFLQGLRALGKGNWRAIARQFIPSRTPTQVASHAQKHFMRVAGATKRKSRFTALEVEVGGPAKQMQASKVDQRASANQRCQEQQPTSSVPQPTALVHSASTPFSAMPFPFLHPLMFGFPGPFFPPFMCPPPPFTAAAMQKQGPMPPMMMPPMLPMAAAMAAMNPFFMAQQMAAAANAAAAAQHAATSGGGTTAGTGPAGTTDTANSNEVPRRMPSAATAPGNPGICKPEAQHARPATAAPATAGATAAQGGASGITSSGRTTLGVGEACGAYVQDRPRPEAAGGSPAVQAVQLPPVAPAGARADDGSAGSFHTSAYSAFRPPQEVKTESLGAGA